MDLFTEIERLKKGDFYVELELTDKEKFINSDTLLKDWRKNIADQDRFIVAKVHHKPVRYVSLVGKSVILTADDLEHFQIKHKHINGKDEVEALIESRTSDKYNEIAKDASAIIETLSGGEYTYFFSQIANKLARIKHGYSVEDSLLDIAGYAKLELEKFRNEKDK